MSDEHNPKFYIPTNVLKLRYGPLTMNIKTSVTSHKINQSNVTILIICVYVLNRNKHAEL